MEDKVKFLVRGQARNGMFLGPDSFNGAVITIRNQSSGEVLAEGLLDTGDSGTRASTASEMCSPYPIETPGNPPVRYFVVAGPTTVQFSGTFALSRPALLEVRARVPFPQVQTIVESSVQVMARPREDLSQGVGIVVPVPGLWVQPELLTLGRQLRLRAKVTMLCGCEINAGSPWLPTDFRVSATVEQLHPQAKVIGTYPMTFQVNSQFYANVILPTTNGYRIRVQAVQVSSGLSGNGVAYV